MVASVGAALTYELHFFRERVIALRIKTIRKFISLESSSGILLFAAAILALIVDNSPLSHYYKSILASNLIFQLGIIHLSKPFLLWVNDGLMCIFFLLVGLEIKREMLEGELNSLAKAALPAVAAVGGMVVPALIYICLNYQDPIGLQGWAIPTATDIAFALAILAVLGSRVTVSLKIFLTAFAILDDIGAIVIIAIFYTKHISVILLLIAAALLVVLFILNRLNVTKFAPYFIVGFFLWVCVLKSGVHATLAGLMVAFAIPIRDKKDSSISPLHDLENMLHPWVAFAILPVFAFANAGVSFKGFAWSGVFAPIPLGIALGLFIGKQVGIWLFTTLAVKSKFVKMPEGMSSSGLYGVALIAGVGFTMSLFIGGLAFGHSDVHYQAFVRVGVLLGSILSGSLGYLVLRVRD